MLLCRRRGHRREPCCSSCLLFFSRTSPSRSTSPPPACAPGGCSCRRTPPCSVPRDTGSPPRIGEKQEVSCDATPWSESCETSRRICAYDPPSPPLRAMKSQTLRLPPSLDVEPPRTSRFFYRFGLSLLLPYYCTTV